MNNITGFSVKYRSAGKKWLKFFFWCHPEVRVKRAHNLSVNRAMCANPATIQKFFKQYQDMLKELKIESPQQIWNCDETGCVDVPKERDVVGETGIEVVTIVSKKQGETSTALTFANAMGQCVPPLIIHKGGKVPKDWEQGAPVGVMVRASPTGWINRNLFLEYATRWVRWLKSWKLLDLPHLLLLDAHKSHVYNLCFIQLMIEMDIHVLAIPPHTSHKVQPLDNAPFANFKTAWNVNLLQYLFQSVGCGMPKMDFFIVFWPSWKKAMTVANIQAGFRQTGIYPFNPNVINPALLGLSQATDNLANLVTEQRKKN